MTSLLHISDTHFGTEQPPVMQAFETHVKAHGADLVLFTGDITQRARREQFASAQAFIKRIKDYGVPQVLTIPGNHDIPMYNLLARIFSPYGNYRRYIDSNLAPIFENDDALIIGLNTTHPTRRKAGKVTARQVEEVAERLQKCDPQKLRIVVAHQPFGSIVASDRRNLQIGARAALERWASSGLDLVMGGHIHLPYVLALSTQYAGLSKEIWGVQAGTTLSSRIRGNSPNSFNRLYLDKRTRQVAIERWEYSDSRAAFERSAEFHCDCVLSASPRQDRGFSP
ncbi:metallophosphoesterase [Pseudomonas hormoni]|uniref:Metallophosphoesterase n=1 Tax=Pseudomonas hormoni TaxID=3093767 RepID=A0ABX8F5D9_9PSED|nr:metallophosphoesterase [Pseudomonas hormoni]QVW26073.1 metallophosphoesterase [Pseudomonas hormoni]